MLVSRKMKNKSNNGLNNRTHELSSVIFIHLLFETIFDLMLFGNSPYFKRLSITEVFRRAPLPQSHHW